MRVEGQEDGTSLISDSLLLFDFYVFLLLFPVCLVVFHQRNDGKMKQFQIILIFISLLLLFMLFFVVSCLFGGFPSEE